MKSKLLLVCLIFLTNTLCFSKTKFNIDLGYVHYPWLGEIPYQKVYKNNSPAAYIGFNLPINRFIEIAPVLGLGKYQGVDFEVTDKMLQGDQKELIHMYFSKKQFINYSLNVKIQLIPLIFQKKINMIDLYVKPKIGGLAFLKKNPSSWAESYSNFDYGMYGGLALNPSKYWGFYYEYGFGNYVKHMAGINFKFNTKE